MTGKTKSDKKAEKVTDAQQNSEEFENDLMHRHTEKRFYKPGMYTRRFVVTEGIPMSDADHEANKQNVVEFARNTGVRTETVDKVELVHDEYWDDGRRELIYQVPVVEVLPTEDLAKAADNREYGSYDPLDLPPEVSYDNSPGSQTEGTKTTPAREGGESGGTKK